MSENSYYSLRIHDRYSETDPELATIMTTTTPPHGPWVDVVSGHPDWCEEVLEALWYRENKQNEKATEQAVEAFHSLITKNNDIVARMRDKIFLGLIPEEQIEECLEAVDEIENLRYKISCLKESLQNLIAEAYRG